MVEMISRLTGSLMYVADDRVSEYLERGHRLPSKPEPIKAEPVAKKVETKKKAPAKKKG